MEIRSHHWLVALSAATLAHLAVVMGTGQAPQPTPPATPVVIQLGEMGAPEGASGLDPGDHGPPAEAVEPGSEPLSPIATPRPAQALAVSEQVKAQLIEPPRPEVSRTPTKPRTKSKPKTKPKVAKKPKPTPRTAKPTNAGRSKGAAIAKRAKSSGKIGTGSGKAGAGKGKGGRGTGKGSGSGAGAKGSANYYGKLASWLNRHKRYPSRARRLRQEGTVKVLFTIDRRGRLLSHRIVASSGHALLDQEVKAMLKRASPLPAFPAGMSQSKLTLTVPIRFNLR